MGATATKSIMSFKTKWFSNRIASSEGYSVRPVGRGAILYEDDRSKIYVSAERMTGERVPTWALYPEDMRLESEFGQKMEDSSLRTLIVERIEAVFAHMGWHLDVVYATPK